MLLQTDVTEFSWHDQKNHNETREPIQIAPIMKPFQDGLTFSVFLAPSWNMHCQQNQERQLGHLNQRHTYIVLNGLPKGQ